MKLLFKESPTASLLLAAVFWYTVAVIGYLWLRETTSPINTLMFLHFPLFFLIVGSVLGARIGLWIGNSDPNSPIPAWRSASIGAAVGGFTAALPTIRLLDLQLGVPLPFAVVGINLAIFIPHVYFSSARQPIPETKKFFRINRTRNLVTAGCLCFWVIGAATAIIVVTSDPQALSEGRLPFALSFSCSTGLLIGFVSGSGARLGLLILRDKNDSGSILSYWSAPVFAAIAGLIWSLPATLFWKSWWLPAVVAGINLIIFVPLVYLIETRRPQLDEVNTPWVS